METWLTAAAAIAAVVIFAAKVIVDNVVEFLRRKHLRRALRSYVARAGDKYDASVKDLDVDKVKQKINGEQGYTPFVFYDPLVTLSAIDIRREYGFLKDEQMDQAVKYVVAECYLQSICADWRTEYVRELAQDRKIGLFEQYVTALKDARKEAGALKKALE